MEWNNAHSLAYAFEWNRFGFIANVKFNSLDLFHKLQKLVPYVWAFIKYILEVHYHVEMFPSHLTIV